MSTIVDLVQWIVNVEEAQKKSLAHIAELEKELAKERERSTGLQTQLARTALKIEPVE